VDGSQYPAAAHTLADLEPQHEYFIGIDSDGCAFDTMELKHKECFIPNIIQYWGLQAVSKYAREAAEFVNLYSRWRGVNRWPARGMVFDLLRERPEVLSRRVKPPLAPRLREFIDDESFAKSDDGLRAYKAKHPDPELETAAAWTLGVNRSVAEMVRGVPPFPYVRESLRFLADRADMIVVSATSVQDLTREWKEHAIAPYVRTIAGQEMGKKALHLELATSGKYRAGKVLMIGDSLGDLKAARDNDALFYPIRPGDEQASWQRFHEEAVHRFLDGEYAGAYETELLVEFEERLPEMPPWQR